MTHIATPSLLALIILSVPQATAQDAAATDTNWPSYRGRNATGIAEGYSLPVRWNVETGENILWKTPIPGLSHSSPVVWGDRIFLTTAVKEGEAELRVGLYGDIGSVEDDSSHQLRVLCVDKSSGEILWSRTAWEGVPAIKRHPKGSHAASTATTDGERVIAFFGSEGLYAYDMEGELLWKKDFGVLDSGFFMVPTAQWGFGSSPVIHGERVIVQCDVQGDSFVAALDVETGEELWRTPREENPTWSTPTVHVDGDRSQVILNGYLHIGGYSLETGEELWRLEGGGDLPVPTPVVAHDLIFITSAHGRMRPILAIATDASGEFTMDAQAHEQMVWSRPRDGIYMQTPLVYGDLLYCCANNGALAVYEARTGDRLNRVRLGTGSTGFTASVVAGEGKLFFSSEYGEVHVVEAGPDLNVLAVNELGETCMATPAISSGALFFRTRGHLLAVAESR